MEHTESKFKIQGGCFCGNIRYTFTSPIPLPEIPIRACSCEFCTRHGNRYTSNPNGELDIVIQDKEKVNEVRFASKTVAFCFCTECGVMPYVDGIIDGNRYAVVNVNTFDEIDLPNVELKFLDLGAQTKDEKIDRRKKVWIPKVNIRNPS